MTLPPIQPIAPTWRKEPFDHPEWLFEVKYDGFRAVCFVENGRCSFVSRRGNVFTRFDALCEQVASALCHDVVSELGVDDAIFDGEVIATDESGRPQFYDLLRRTRSPSYIAFDLLWLNGTDLRALPLRERRRWLEMMLPTGSPTISEAVSVEARGRELFDMMCAHDLEGIVAKRLADPYELRVRWLKIKNPDYSQKEGRGDLFNTPPRGQSLMTFRAIVAALILSTTAQGTDAPSWQPPMSGRASIWAQLTERDQHDLVAYLRSLPPKEQGLRLTAISRS